MKLLSKFNNKKIYITPYSDNSKWLKIYLEFYLKKFIFLGYLDDTKKDKSVIAVNNINKDYDYILIFSENYYLNIYSNLIVAGIKNKSLFNIKKTLNGIAYNAFNEKKIPYENTLRKKIICFGNCQLHHIAKRLSDSLSYHIYDIMYYSNYDNYYSKTLILQAISNADILIYQPFDDQYKELREANINQHTKSTCKLISLPIIHNNGVYSLEYNGLLAVGEDTILKLLQNGKTKTEIIHAYKNNKIDFNLKEKFSKSMQIMKWQEQYTDIKLTNFIEKNYTKYKLFANSGHPTNKVFFEIVKQIGKILSVHIIQRKNNYIQEVQSTLTPISPHDIQTHKYTFNYYQDTQWDMVGKTIIEIIINNFKLTGKPLSKNI
ncbi:WcbI family polysaccharide biosynthesis putative acetyltransferase [Sulfurimonas sp.]